MAASWAAREVISLRQLKIGERGTIILVFFDCDNIGAKGFGYLALNFPASDVPTISKERAADRFVDLEPP
jgi:hypothetical protein